jgi:DNA ligase-1
MPKEVQTFVKSWSHKYNEDEALPYSVVVNIFEEISKVSGRIDKENLFSKLFSAILATNPQELESIVYLSSNHVSPVYDGLELGVGDSLLIKAICEATGRKKDAVDEAYEKEGDLGVVAVQSRNSQKTLGFAMKPKPLNAPYVLEQFRLITQIKGEKAQARKVEIIKSLMIRCQGQEAKYIIRALQGKLRIGTAEQTVLVALAHSMVDCQRSETLNENNTSKEELSRLENREFSAASESTAAEFDNPQDIEKKSLEELYASIHAKETFEARYLRRHWLGHITLPREKLNEYSEITIKRAFSECPNLSLLVKACLQTPLYNLFEVCKLEMGVPVAPMLAKPTKQINDVLKRLSGQAFTMEYKYDGERAQVHLLPDGSVKIFSRNSEDNTEKYPDLKDIIR